MADTLAATSSPRTSKVPPRPPSDQKPERQAPVRRHRSRTRWQWSRQSSKVKATPQTIKARVAKGTTLNADEAGSGTTCIRISKLPASTTKKPIALMTPARIRRKATSRAFAALRLGTITMSQGLICSATHKKVLGAKITAVSRMAIGEPPCGTGNEAQALRISAGIGSGT